MHIIFEGKSYNTENAEAICEHYSEGGNETYFEHFTETLYRTTDGRFFTYSVRFSDSEDRIRSEGGCLVELVRIMSSEEAVLWLRIEALREEKENDFRVFFAIAPENPAIGTSDPIYPIS